MRFFRADVEVVDHPASVSYSVVVYATTYNEARILAREGALHFYESGAGGWSRNPKASVQHIEHWIEPEGAHVVSVVEEHG